MSQGFQGLNSNHDASALLYNDLLDALIYMAHKISMPSISTLGQLKSSNKSWCFWESRQNCRDNLLRVKLVKFPPLASMFA